VFGVNEGFLQLGCGWLVGWNNSARSAVETVSPDLWLAAHAIAARLTLVTSSEKEFRRVRGLKLQNWTL